MGLWKLEKHRSKTGPSRVQAAPPRNAQVVERTLPKGVHSSDDPWSLPESASPHPPRAPPPCVHGLAPPHPSL